MGSRVVTLNTYYDSGPAHLTLSSSPEFHFSLVAAVGPGVDGVPLLGDSGRREGQGRRSSRPAWSAQRPEGNLLGPVYLRPRIFVDTRGPRGVSRAPEKGQSWARRAPS